MGQKIEGHFNGGLLFRNSFALYFRMFVLLLVGLFTSRVTISALGVEDYGIYHLVGSVVVIFSFVSSSLSGVTQRFLSVKIGEDDGAGLKRVFESALFLHFIVAFALFSLTECVGLWLVNYKLNISSERIFTANVVFQFSLFQYILSVLTIPYVSCIVAHEKMFLFAKLTFFEVIAKLFISCALLYVNADKLIIFVVLLFVLSNVNRFLYILYCKRSFAECRGFSLKTDRRTMGEIASFSSWSVVGGFVAIVNYEVLPILVNFFFGVVVNAALGISTQVNRYVYDFLNNFIVAFKPQIVKTYASKEFGSLRLIVAQGCKYSFILVSLIVIPIFVEAPTLLKLWLNDVPSYTIPFVRSIMILTLIDSFSSVLSSVVYAIGKIKVYQIYMSLLFLTYLPLVYMVFRMGKEPYWSFVIYAFIVFVAQLFRIPYVCCKIGISLFEFFKNVVFRCILLLLCASSVPVVLHCAYVDSFFTTIINCVVAVVSVLFFSYFVGLSVSERQNLLQFFKSIFLGRKRSII